MPTILLLFAGLCAGSFVNAFVWRINNHKDWLRGRSECVHCHHILAARDLVPVFSWLTLKGKCRYCHKPISRQYPIIELITAGLFVFSYNFWPTPLHGQGMFSFIIWLLMLVGLIALFIYDARWFLLPNIIVYSMMAIGVLNLISVTIWGHHALSTLLGALCGVIIIAGTFWVLYQISKGRWIGGGDVKLGVFLGLLVGGPLNSILLLLISSIAGTAYSLPLVLSGKAGRKSHIPFGPFLIIGAMVVTLFGTSITNWYKHLYI